MRRFGLDGGDKLGRKVSGQTLNDVEQLQDFLLTQGFNLVVQQFDFESQPSDLFCSCALRVCGQSRIGNKRQSARNDCIRDRLARTTGKPSPNGDLMK